MTYERLSQEIDPPAHLEERTVALLRSHHLLVPRRAHRGWQAAAAIMIFALGAASGAMWNGDRERAIGQPRFLLLLHGATTVSADEEARAAEAYGTWARGLAGEGRYITGERLAADAVAVPAASGRDEPVVGYFVVSAVDLAEASRIAQSAPHVARGGSIVVRPIDTP